jgi:putative membrane protein
MEVLAHPIKNFKKHIKLIIPVVIGIGIGFLGLAKLVELLFKSNMEVATCVFVGLILGMLPSLWKEAGEYGRPKSSFVGGAVAAVLLFGLFTYIEFGTELSITPNPFWYAVCGIFWGLGVVVPGMSASSPLLFLGLYDPLMGVITSFLDNGVGFISGKLSFTAALGGMQFLNAIPFGIAIIVTLLGLAKPVNYLLSKKPSQMYHTIFGIVLGTTLPVLFFTIGWGSSVVLKIAFIILGFIAAWLLDKLSRKFAGE